MRKNTALNISVYIIVRIVVLASAVLAFADGRTATALQCLLSFALFMLPSIIERRFKLELPSAFEFAVILFIFASTFLGEVGGYYDKYRLWDSILHITSGFLTTAIGFSVIDILNRSEAVKFSLSAGFVALFAFCFSITAGVIWEFYEFFMDKVFLTDMQKDTVIHEFSSALLGMQGVMVESASLNGQTINGWLDVGLTDTMKDLIVCAVGALIFSVFGYLYVKKREQGWIARFIPRRIRQNDRT